jgi:DNA-binding response OmpR family regulator
MAETILIVEDNLETLELLRRILERDGYETILASDGEKGLRYAKRDLPDLVILDRLMPKLDGLQVCRKLKEQDTTRHIPIVFLSILDSERDVIDGLKAGADDYITKPFSPDELSVRVERVLFRSVRSTIEDLLEEGTSTKTWNHCFDPLVERITRKERRLRSSVGKNIAALTELGRRWTALFRGQQVSASREKTGGETLLSREVQRVNRYTVLFNRALREYGLLRWLISLVYRLGREIQGGIAEENEAARTLKRLYAESVVVTGKVKTALRLLEKTDRFLHRTQK